jgi:hypothetical protein
VAKVVTNQTPQEAEVTTRERKAASVIELPAVSEKDDSP